MDIRTTSRSTNRLTASFTIDISYGFTKFNDDYYKVVFAGACCEAIVFVINLY